MYIMNAIFYEPLTKIIDERDSLVHDNYEHSRQSRHKAEKLLKDKENRLTETAKQSRQIMVDKTNEANSDYKAKVDAAKAKSNAQVDELKAELSRSENEAKEILNSHVENLAQTIVNKVLQGGQIHG